MVWCGILDETKVKETVKDKRERVERGELKSVLYLPRPTLELIECYMAKELRLILGAGRTDVHFVDISPGSVWGELSIYLDWLIPEQQECLGLKDPERLRCLEKLVWDRVEREGHTKKIVIKYPGYRVEARKHMTYSSNGIDYSIRVAVDGEEIGLKAVSDPLSVVKTMAEAVRKVLDL